MTRAQLDLEKQLREYAVQYEREFETTAQMEQGIIARIATTPREARQAPTLRRDLALAAVLLLFVGLLAVGIARIRLQQPLPAHPSPTAPYPGGASRSSSPFFVSPEVGWIQWSTNDSPSGALFKTTDAGTHWQRQLTLDVGPMGGCALDVSATEGLYICIRGSYRTSDGGAHWQRLDLPSGENIAFAFLNSREAWTASSSLFHTTDAGQHWTEVVKLDQVKGLSHGDSLGWGQFMFRDALSGWLVPRGYLGPGPSPPRSSPYLYRTRDGGKTWTQQTLSPTVGGAFTDISLPQFFNDRNGVLIVSAPEGMYAYSTSDGGDHWSRPRPLTVSVPPCTRIPRKCLPVGAGAVVFGDSRHWFLAAGQSLARSSDGGQHWEVLANVLSADVEFAGLGFIDANNGWASVVGTTQSVNGQYRTVDGGAHWTLVAFPNGG